jgi:small subunit ribosomal protein S7
VARRKIISKRKIKPDPIYRDKTIAKLINQVMVDGKKSISEKIVYNALEIISKNSKNKAQTILEKALNNVKPLVEVKSRRVGGSTYQVPIEVHENRALTLGIRWLVTFAKQRKDNNMTKKLAAEILEAADEDQTGSFGKGKGGAVKKREDIHKMADANKAFSHYRW